jgi:hypothetical protein
MDDTKYIEFAVYQATVPVVVLIRQGSLGRKFFSTDFLTGV